MMNTPFLALSPVHPSTGSTAKTVSMPEGQVGQHAHVNADSATNPFVPAPAPATDTSQSPAPHAFVIEFGDALKTETAVADTLPLKLFSAPRDVLIAPPQANTAQTPPVTEDRIEASDEPSVNTETPPIAATHRAIPPLEMRFLAQPNHAPQTVSPAPAVEISAAGNAPVQPAAAPSIDISKVVDVSTPRETETPAIPRDPVDAQPVKSQNTEVPLAPATTSNTQNVANLASPQATPEIATPAAPLKAAPVEPIQNAAQPNSSPRIEPQINAQARLQGQENPAPQTSVTAPARAENVAANAPIAQATAPAPPQAPPNGAAPLAEAPTTAAAPSSQTNTLPLANAYSKSALPTPLAASQNERQADWRAPEQPSAPIAATTASLPRATTPPVANMQPETAPVPSEEPTTESRQAQTANAAAAPAMNAAQPKEAPAAQLAQTTPFLSNTGERAAPDRAKKTSANTQDYTTQTASTTPAARNTIPTPTAETVEGMFAQSGEKLESLFTDATQSEVSFRAELGALETNRSAILQATRDFTQMRPDLARSVAQQLAQAATGDTDAPMELTLSPEELGRVRLTFSPTENGMAVSVMAERPETLELMRRNIDSLAQEFLGIGYEDVSFNFSQSGADQNGSDDQNSQNQAQSSNGLSNEARLQDDAKTPPPVKVDLTQSDRLDIRL